MKYLIILLLCIGLCGCGKPYEWTLAKEIKEFLPEGNQYIIIQYYNDPESFYCITKISKKEIKKKIRKQGCLWLETDDMIHCSGRIFAIRQEWRDK